MMMPVVEVAVELIDMSVVKQMGQS